MAYKLKALNLANDFSFQLFEAEGKQIVFLIILKWYLAKRR